MSHEHTKSLSLRIKSNGKPSDEQLAKIRQFTLADLSADDLYVRQFVLAHNAIDRDNECFDEQLLADCARTLPGKGLFIKHPMGWDGDSGPGEGRWFDAHTESVSLDDARKLLREPLLTLPPDRTTVMLLYADGYMAKTEDNASLLKKLDAGVAGDVSIGFNYTDRQRLKDREGRELNAFRLTGPGEALEGSLVWLGAQPGARAVKHANRSRENHEETMDPTQKQQLDDANAKVTELTAKVANAEKATTLVAALKTALGDNATLLDTADGIKSLVELVSAGKDHRKALIDTIVAGERHRGTIGDTDQAVNDAKAAYADLPTAKLKTFADTLGHKGAPGIKPADPNARTPGDKSAPEGSILANPLIAAPAAA